MNLLVSLANLALTVIIGNSLYQYFESKKKVEKIEETPKKESHLVDMPMRYEQHYNYADEERKKTLSDDVELLKDE